MDGTATQAIIYTILAMVLGAIISFLIPLSDED